MHFITSSLLVSLFLISTGVVQAQTTPKAPSPSPSKAPTQKQSKIGPWKCDLAQDGSGIPQTAYCCDENTVDRRYQDGRILAVTDCTAVPVDQNVQCAHAADVWCCYGLEAEDASKTPGSEWVCTSVAHWKPS